MTTTRCTHARHGMRYIYTPCLIYQEPVCLALHAVFIVELPVQRQFNCMGLP